MGCLPTATAQDAGGKSKVFYVVDAGAARAGGVRQGYVKVMVDSLVMAVTGKSTVAAAWRIFVKPSDRVGIKVSAAGRSVSGTHPEVVAAVISGLRAAGVERIVVWDRNLEDLRGAGFDPKQFPLRWTEEGNGYDKEMPITAPLMGRLIWGDLRFVSKPETKLPRRGFVEEPELLSHESFVARILTRDVDKVIHIPSLTDSFLTGVNGALAGMSIGVIDNWRRFTKPPLFGNPFVAEVYAEPIIRDRVVLTILDGLTMQFGGGPFPNPQFAELHATLYASTDPVAIDAVALSRLDERRAVARLPSLKKMTQYLEAAEQLGLGNSEKEKIELVKVRSESVIGP